MIKLFGNKKKAPIILPVEVVYLSDEVKEVLLPLLHQLKGNTWDKELANSIIEIVEGL